MLHRGSIRCGLRAGDRHPSGFLVQCDDALFEIGSVAVHAVDGSLSTVRPPQDDPAIDGAHIRDRAKRIVARPAFRVLPRVVDKGDVDAGPAGELAQRFQAARDFRVVASVLDARESGERVDDGECRLVRDRKQPPTCLVAFFCGAPSMKQ